MNSTVPLTQDIESVAKTHELVPSENLDFENNRKGPNWVQGGRWVRWTVASLMLLGLVWFMIISKESSEPVGLEPASTPRSINGTDLMVRAYKIPDPSESRLGQRSFSGTLQARYQSLLGFRVAGKIIHRGVEVGDRVTKGQILFRLDPTDYDLQLQVAQADLEAAKSQLVQIEAEEGRLADLRKTRSTSQSDYDLAVSLRDTARSRLQAAGNRETLAKNQRQYADLVADQDGLVTRLMAEVGQVVSPGQPVGQWVHGTELEAVVSVPESMQQALSQSRASVEFWSMPGVSVPCTLREISPIADPASRTYDAKFTLVDPPKGLAIGMTANVVIYRDQEDGFSIPMGAIAESQGSPIVWRIVADGRVQAVPVEILKYGSQFATVRGSLGQGDQIISAGVQRIDPQCKVRVWQDNL